MAGDCDGVCVAVGVRPVVTVCVGLLDRVALMVGDGVRVFDGVAVEVWDLVTVWLDVRLGVAVLVTVCARDDASRVSMSAASGAAEGRIARNCTRHV